MKQTIFSNINKELMIKQYELSDSCHINIIPSCHTISLEDFVSYPIYDVLEIPWLGICKS